MNSNYKIKVNIEIVECHDEIQPEPQQQKKGYFEFVISDEQGCSINGAYLRNFPIKLFWTGIT